MKTVHGDLIQLALDGQFDVIIHGCNCFCTMGAGIAKSVRSAFPEAYAADRATAKGDRAKLGKTSQATIERDGIRLTVVNAYTQFHWRGRGVKADYDAIRSAARAVAAAFPDARIGYPKIGAGLAGGDWPTIEAILRDEFASVDHTLVLFDGA